MGRYTPPASPAEAAEREAARAARLEQLHATLAEQVGAIRNGEDWQRWLAVASRFPSYSINNVLLIAAQRPDATAVAGFGAWKALGRQVDKGSKGIAILAPLVRRPNAGAPAGADAGAEPAAQAGARAGAGEFVAGPPAGGGEAGAGPRDPEGDRTGRPAGPVAGSPVQGRARLRRLADLRSAAPRTPSPDAAGRAGPGRSCGTRSPRRCRPAASSSGVGTAPAVRTG
jgi:hypothetical protein